MKHDDLSPCSLGVVVVAAGSSSRMQGVDKLFFELEGIPVVVRSIRAFDELPFVREIVVVSREENLPLLWDLQRSFSLEKVTKIIRGGDTRQESVFAGARALDADCRYIAIHDAARPFVSAQDITSCFELACEKRAAAAAVPVKDTIKQADENGAILGTPPRDSLFIAQTPQIFESTLYRAAMENALALGESFTDDCQLVEKLGHRVYLSRGSYLNFKLTTPEDLILAQAISAGEIY